MDIEKLSKDLITYQKQSTHTVFDSLILLSGFASKAGKYWACKMGLDESGLEMIETWRLLMKEGCGMSKGLADEEWDLLGKSLTDVKSMFTPPNESTQ